MVRDTETMTLTVGSLFSGIGGLDLGLERAGMRVIWQSEIDPYACRVLKKHWKDVPNHGNIKEIDWDNVERPDVICGGYPCQPFSQAGKRQGTDDPRHLFPWVLEAISRLRPRYAILENVRGHLSLGGTTVIASLASIGYDAEWRVVSAASVGAAHRRDRLFIVSYPNSSNAPNGRECTSVQGSCRGRSDDRRGSQCNFGQVSLGSSGKTSSEVPDHERQRDGEYWIANDVTKISGRGVFDSQGKEGYDGWKWWEAEPRVDRVAYGVPNRVDRLRGLGNAVVPQVAEVIGRLVVAHAG